MTFASAVDCMQWHVVEEVPPISPRPESLLAEGLRHALDRNALRFGGDRTLFAKLRKERYFRKPGRYATGGPLAERMALLGRSMRLSLGLAPKVERALKRCLSRLELDADVELYCMNAPHAEAFVLTPRRQHVILCLSAALIGLLDETELTSVIGHQLGHVILGHLALQPLGMGGDERVAPMDAMRAYAWLRYAELSADRVALHCCGDLEATLSAELKLAAGLDPHLLGGDLGSLAAEQALWRSEHIGTTEHDWFAVHPYSALRILGLRLFARSVPYIRLGGAGSGELTLPELEREERSLMELMDPVILTTRSRARREAREFVAMACVEVALAQAGPGDDERLIIEETLHDRALRSMIGSIVGAARYERRQRLRALGDELELRLPLVRRRKLLEDIAAVALAHPGGAAAREGALAELCDMLHCQISLSVAARSPYLD
jgi:hypothetical protein